MDRINKVQELMSSFWTRLWGITDIEVGPDNYLYILTTNNGGHNCNESNNNGCIEYSSGEEGAIFRNYSKKGIE